MNLALYRAYRVNSRSQRFIPLFQVACFSIPVIECRHTKTPEKQLFFNFLDEVPHFGEKSFFVKNPDEISRAKDNEYGNQINK